MKLPFAVFMVVCLGPGSFSAQQASAQPLNVKTAAEEFKNVQVLKRVPADQWFDTMAFIAGSLGVTCDHCHTSSFELDEGNPAKLKARQMMRMMDEINAGNFEGKNVITCNTCHRGALKPQAAPVPDADHWKKAAEKASTLPPAAELIARYRRAVGGGKAAVSQSVTLEMETYGGKGAARRSSVEVLLDGSARIREIDREGATTRTLIKNGSKAWAKEGSSWREMNQGEASTSFEAADILIPDQVGDMAPSGQVFQDHMYRQQVFVVPVNSKGERRWLYFDPDSGLLIRQRIFFDSFYADGSVDIEYADYRKFGNVLLPNVFFVVNAGGSGLTIRKAIVRKIDVKLKEDQFTAAGA